MAYDDNNKTLSKNAKSSMTATTNMLSGIENILVNARDDIYLTEYATGMFSCYTTGKKDGAVLEESDPGYEKAWFTLAGDNENYHKMTKEYNKMFMAEQEYILWGKQEPKDNVNNTLTAIFGVRFALNSLYAFTGDVEIDAVTLAWATAIAGWTGFGVPIVQSVLKIALALAESTYDISLLKEGYDVALYKTSDTWVMKPSGITKETIERTEHQIKEVAKNAVDSTYEYVDNLATTSIEKVNESVADTVQKAENTLIEQAVATVVSPFQKQMVALASKTDMTKEKITAEVNKVYDNIYNNIDSGSALGQLEKWIMDSQGNEIKSFFIGKAESLCDSTNQTLSKNWADEISKTLKEKAKGATIVKEYGDGLKKEVSDKLASMNEKTQEVVSEGVSNAVSGYLNKMQGSKGADSTVANGFAVTVNYQEYLHIFLILKSMTNEGAYLTRISHLIQFNMAKRKEGFALNKSFTMIALNAGVNVNTTFIGKLNSVLENPVDAKTKYTLKYNGVSGY